MNTLLKRALLAFTLLAAPAAFAVSALQPAASACCCEDCRCATGDCCCKGDRCPTR